LPFDEVNLLNAKTKQFLSFKLDFVWEHKKKVIEIDGKQHKELEEQIRRDSEKDKALLEHGYEILRIDWKLAFNDTKHWMKIAKDFIDN